MTEDNNGGFTMKNLTKTLILIAIFIIAFAVTASADQVGYTTADVLNVRSQPNMTAQIVAQYPYGTSVSVTGSSDVWYQIRFNSGYAYVHSDYVKFAAQATPYQQTMGQQVVEKAKQYIGIPYLYGGTTPAGFDCSGFVQYVYAQFGVRLNRTAADQSYNGYAVSQDALMPGDILCFANAGGTGYIGHVGIYVGDGMFIHSPRTGYTICIESLNTTNYGNRIAAARRIF